MPHRHLTLILTLVLTAVAAAVLRAADVPADHGVFLPDKITWGTAPPSLPAGARLAVLEGDRSKPGLFAMRLWMPDGYKIPPHTHPAVEHVTVVMGTFHVGMGARFDKSTGHKLPTGSFAFLAPKMQHFAWSEGDTVIQLHGTGPWQINYINPADDPRGRN